MRLEEVVVMPYRLPLGALLRTVGSEAPAHREGFLLVLRDRNGEVGIGEASPAWWVGGERLEETGAVLKEIAADRKCVSQVRRVLNDGLGAAGLIEDPLLGERMKRSPAARCAFDTARLDCEARQCGTSVAERLGATAGLRLRVNGLIVASGPDGVETQALALVARGFGTIKLKVGARGLREDVERLAALRRVTRGAISLRLDANRAWEADAARAALRAFEGEDVEYVEEPLRHPSPEQIRRLRSQVSVPIALDESLASTEDIERFASACDVAVIKLARVGGPTAALDMAGRAAALGPRVTFTDSIETAVGRAATVHAAAASPGACADIGLGGAALLRGDPFGPWGDSPRVSVEGPGLGLNPRNLEAVRARMEKYGS